MGASRPDGAVTYDEMASVSLLPFSAFSGIISCGGKLMSKRQANDRAPRARTNLSATLTDSSEMDIVVTIIDLSAEGFRLRTVERLEVGESIRLQAGKDESQPARILWVRDHEAGGVFLLPPQLAA
jgi:lauroyl/myristoyl acyltransferase